MSGPVISKKTSGEIGLAGMIAYAAPVAGTFFFYVPMWSILPGIYATHHGLPLSQIGAVLLFIRVFDGFIDIAIGYASDWRRARGGSRKPWVICGCMATLAACHALFNPPPGVTVSYYLVWSLLYFFAFTLSEIPHVTWGSELTFNYQQRAKVFAVRTVAIRLGTIAVFGLPLLPLYASADYTPQVLSDAVWIGAAMVFAGLGWMLLAAPAGVPAAPPVKDSPTLLIRSILRNQPLLLYFAAYAALGIAGGMWYALMFFFLVTYLGLGAKFALILMVATAISALTTPLWLAIIRRTSKRSVWLIGIALFVVQCLASYGATPGGGWLLPFLLVLAVQIFFVCHDTAANSMLGDIIDYGRFKFGRDRGATYFGINTLIFKIGVGVGGGLGLAVAGGYGFDATKSVQSAGAIAGLRTAFALLPLLFSAIGTIFILLTPIGPRRHGIIQRRLERRIKAQQSYA
jgi:GPH family glycoside/pentoside/hexuronide:cation symporter